MIALAFDTATEATAVALSRDGEITEARDDPGAGERPRHAAQALPLAHELLAAAGLRFADVDTVVAGIGPGTYTGLRIGLATAQALAGAAGARLVGVGTLRTLARAGDGPLYAVIDARRGEAFVAGYDGPQELLAPAVVAPERLAELIPAGSTAVGGGAVRFREELEAGGAVVAPGDSPFHRVSAGVACRLVAAGEIDARDDAVAPLYLRLPDAELALRGGTR
jgi:tRNA threonylcarbamoyladenosine biosynthesis protein TsaB